MNLHLVAYILPLFIAGLAIPMIIGIVPPNGLYGFGTSKTLSLREISYKANRVQQFVNYIQRVGASEAEQDQGPTAFLDLVADDIAATTFHFPAMREVWNRVADERGLPEMKKELYGD